MTGIVGGVVADGTDTSDMRSPDLDRARRGRIAAIRPAIGLVPWLSGNRWFGVEWPEPEGGIPGAGALRAVVPGRWLHRFRRRDTRASAWLGPGRQPPGRPGNQGGVEQCS